MQECTDMAEHHQMRERLEFYHQHPLPPLLPCFAGGDMRGGARKRGQGGLRRSEHSFNSPLLSSPLLFRPFIKRMRSTLGQRWLTADLSFSSSPSLCLSLKSPRLSFPSLALQNVQNSSYKRWLHLTFLRRALMQ